MKALRERAPIRSPLKTIGIAGIEAVWHLSHLRQLFAQKNTTGPEETQTWLQLIHNPDSGEQEVVLGEKLTTGLFFSVYRYRRGEEERVLKIGHRNTPAYGYPSPSTEEFFHWYKDNLKLQQRTFGAHLPHFILPQDIRFAHNDERATVLIDQPYVPHTTNKETFHCLSKEEKKRILDEYNTVVAIRKYLSEKGGLIPDLFGDLLTGGSNLVIAQTEDGPHLVLLDNGLIDFDLKAPIVNLVFDVGGKVRTSLERKFTFYLRH